MKVGNFTHFYALACLEREKLVNFLQNNFQMQEISVMKRKWIWFLKMLVVFSLSSFSTCGLGLTCETQLPQFCFDLSRALYLSIICTSLATTQQTTLLSEEYQHKIISSSKQYKYHNYCHYYYYPQTFSWPTLALHCQFPHVIF